MVEKSVYKAILFGVAVGDAIGVPVEFKSRESIAQNPVTEMIGYQTHNQPPGTFSDDSSLTFCLAEGLTKDFDLENIAENFIKWYTENYWTARGEVFDIGIATEDAIMRLLDGVKSDLAGGFDEQSNGNGSLMRILPLLLYIMDKPINERYEITKQVSSITHGHIQSIISCFYYLEFARQIVKGGNKFEVYSSLKTEITNFLNSLEINPLEIQVFNGLLYEDIRDRVEAQIYSSGYVLHTLEASIWCLLNTDSYEAAVLKAVNLGDDTDTTGAVTGGLAALVYGFGNIPKKWIDELARKSDIDDLVQRLFEQNNNNY